MLSSSSSPQVENEMEENIIEYSPVFHINPQELKKRLLSPPIGYNRNDPASKIQDGAEEECLIFRYFLITYSLICLFCVYNSNDNDSNRTMAPSGVQNRKTVDLGKFF